VLAHTGASNNIEDLKHFMLECPVYDDLRAACPAFADPALVQLDDQDCVVAVFQHPEQSALAHTLYKMKVRRARLLGRQGKAYPGHLTDLTLLLVSTLVSSSPPSLLHK
jgi:hypothetical protein